MVPALPIRGILIAAVLLGVGAPAATQNRTEASPAARTVPQAATQQSYPPELIEAGRIRFTADCAFCHGKDAAGGAGGTDLTRSALVAEDLRGDRIGDVVRSGRIDKGMPAFGSQSESEFAAIVAYIHAQQANAGTTAGGRRSVELADLQSGNANAGRRYFEAECARCHSAQQDLAGIAGRLEGLPLLRRMLYPGSEGGKPPSRPTVRVTTRDGLSVTGRLAYRDEFTIALVDADGRYRSWPTDRVEHAVTDPLAAHAGQLAQYTDRDMHDVLAYLHTLH